MNFLPTINESLTGTLPVLFVMKKAFGLLAERQDVQLQSEESPVQIQCRPCASLVSLPVRYIRYITLTTHHLCRIRPKRNLFILVHFPNKQSTDVATVSP